MSRKIDDFFNISRFLKLFVLDFKKDYRGFLIALGGIYAFFLIPSLISGYTGAPNEYLSTYLFLFIIGGAAITGRVFKDYYRRDRNTPLLMLPASKVEKWFEKLVLSSIGWIAVSFTGFSVYTLLAAGLNELIFGVHSSPVWWDKILIDVYLHYFIIHAVVFLGASVYKKLALFKTILSLFVIGFMLSLISLFFARIIFSDLFHYLINFPRGTVPPFFYNIPADWEPTLMKWARIFKWLYWLIIPYCWGVSFVRFTEIEVKDGV